MHKLMQCENYIRSKLVRMKSETDLGLKFHITIKIKIFVVITVCSVCKVSDGKCMFRSLFHVPFEAVFVVWFNVKLYNRKFDAAVKVRQLAFSLVRTCLVYRHVYTYAHCTYRAHDTFVHVYMVTNGSSNCCKIVTNTFEIWMAMAGLLTWMPPSSSGGMHILFVHILCRNNIEIIVDLNIYALFWLMFIHKLFRIKATNIW